MFDFSTLPLTPDEARAARNYFGLNQQQASDESSLPVHKIKRFETGNHIPDTKFLEDLRAFYEGRGYDFPGTTKPGAKAIATGNVFPAGVVQSEHDEDAPVGKPQKHMVQHIRIDPSLSDDVIGNIFDHIERNEDSITNILHRKVASALFGGFTESSEATHGKALRLLAENGTLFAKLLGRPLVDAPSDELMGGQKKPATHAELLAHTQMHMHRAIEGDKESIARHKEQKPTQSLTDAIFG
jgi:hypothetical protein